LTSPESSSDGWSPVPVTAQLRLDHVAPRVRRLSPSQLGLERGCINILLNYDIERSALQVTVVNCCDLPELAISSDGECLLDPYVKLQLLPEKQHRMKTRLVRGTRNPQYDEQFTLYGISVDQLSSTSLHFAVVAFDRYSRDAVLAETVHPLVESALLDGVEQQLQLPLQARTAQLGDQRGQVLVSLCYQPATSRVTIVLLKAKDLPKFDITGLADPYIKIYMLYNGQRVAKKKTHVKKRTLTPVYNESFVFELPAGGDDNELDQVSFEVCAMDWDRVTKNEQMGSCTIDGRSEHWLQVRSNPRRQIAEWHTLHA